MRITTFGFVIAILISAFMLNGCASMTELNNLIVQNDAKSYDQLVAELEQYQNYCLDYDGIGRCFNSITSIKKIGIPGYMVNERHFFPFNKKPKLLNLLGTLAIRYDDHETGIDGLDGLVFNKRETAKELYIILSSIYNKSANK